MSRIYIRIPQVKPCPEGRPQACPHCSNPALQRWGKTTKPLKDPQLSQVEVHRYRCPSCRRTFRFYPQGVCSWTQSRRAIYLCALLWSLGLSLRAVTSLLDHFGFSLSRMSVLRDVRALLREVGGRFPYPVRVLGVDGFGVRLRGKTRGVVVCVEMERGLPVAMFQVDEKDPRAVVRALEPLVKALGVEVLVSDDLSSYRRVAEELGLRHQVCTYHLLRWAGRTLGRLLRKVEGAWKGVVEEAWGLVRARAPDGGRRLFELYLRVVKGLGRRKREPLWELAQVLLRLSEGWQRYTLERREEGVPGTNNRTEQAIGRFRWRSRGMRGIKSWQGVEAAMVLGHVWPG